MTGEELIVIQSTGSAPCPSLSPTVYAHGWFISVSGFGRDRRVEIEDADRRAADEPQRDQEVVRRAPGRLPAVRIRSVSALPEPQEPELSGLPAHVSTEWLLDRAGGVACLRMSNQTGIKPMTLSLSVGLCRNQWTVPCFLSKVTLSIFNINMRVKQT